jgi:hypothetical protein
LLAVFFPSQAITPGSFAEELYYASDTDACWGGAQSPAQNHPRHPERSATYQLFDNHFDSYVRAYEEQFEPRSGPLRPVVVRSVEELLSCGRRSREASREFAARNAGKSIFWPSRRTRMRIVSFITEPCVIDRIVRCLCSAHSKTQDPFEPRPPPAAVSNSLQ